MAIEYINCPPDFEVTPEQLTELARILGNAFSKNNEGKKIANNIVNAPGEDEFSKGFRKGVNEYIAETQDKNPN